MTLLQIILLSNYTLAKKNVHDEKFILDRALLDFYSNKEFFLENKFFFKKKKKKRTIKYVIRIIS
jgi:hypothetical protein